MPFFYFNVLDGVADIDRDGTDLADVDEAWRQARRLASDMVKSDCEWEKLGDEWRIEVTDRTGIILFRIDISAMRSPLMRTERRPE